jgi:hypothetical protein
MSSRAPRSRVLSLLPPDEIGDREHADDDDGDPARTSYFHVSLSELLWGMDTVTLRVSAPLDLHDSLGERVTIQYDGVSKYYGMVVGRLDRVSLLISLDVHPWWQRIWQRVPVILMHCLPREIRHALRRVKALISQ